MYNDPDKTISERFNELDSQRRGHLDRGRMNAMLTIPRLLPPEDWSEEISLPNPYSSVASKGVTNLASRMLAALIPLNDMPFFGFSLNYEIHKSDHHKYQQYRCNRCTIDVIHYIS